MKTFELVIESPEREFFRGEVEAVNFLAPDGEVGILADHAPMVAPLLISCFRFKAQGQWRSAFIAEGFLKVSAKGVSVFTTAVEWPGDIDVGRAERARARAEDKLRAVTAGPEKTHFEQSFKRANMRIKVAAMK